AAVKPTSTGFFRTGATPSSRRMPYRNCFTAHMRVGDSKSRSASCSQLSNEVIWANLGTESATVQHENFAGADCRDCGSRKHHLSSQPRDGRSSNQAHAG